MARRLADTVATAFCARGETLERCALFDVDGLYLQLVDIGAVIVLGVRDGGLNDLLDDSGSFFLREGQDVERLIHAFAAYQISDQTALVDRQITPRRVARVSMVFPYFLTTFLSAG